MLFWDMYVKPLQLRCNSINDNKIYKFDLLEAVKRSKGGNLLTGNDSQIHVIIL